MQDNYQGSNYPETNIHHKTGADNQTISKIVDAVTNEVKITKGMNRTDTIMAVAPMQIFFQNKEEYKA